MHISDLRRFQRCPRLYMLSKQDDQHSFPYLNICCDIKQSIMAKMHITSCFEGQPNDDNAQADQAMKSYEWLCHPRFEYRGLRTKAYFIHNMDGLCDLYFVILSIAPTDTSAFNIRLTRDIIIKCGYRVNNIYIIHLNGSYIRGPQLDDDQLWVITDRFCNSSGHPSRLITESINRLKVDADTMIDQLLHFDSDEQSYIAPVRSADCIQKTRCPYYDDCFPAEKDQPDDTILSLTGSSRKFEMFSDGIHYLSQADSSLIEGNRQQYAQIMADRNNGFFIDRLGIKTWLNDNVRTPLCFMDFEWDLYAIPPYSGMKPMEVLPFEFAVVKREDGTQTHIEYVGSGDDRQQFIEQLLQALPKTGTIFAYNAIGAESIRLLELIQAFPQYKKALEDIRGRLVDLALPFSMGMIYDVRMKGMYSLKTIQNLLDKEHDYHKLEVSDGLQAVLRYRQLSREQDPVKKQQAVNALKEYCGLDALSLLNVYDYLTASLKEGG